MKKTLILFLMICGIVLTSSIQAKNLDNSNEVWQNENTPILTATQGTSEASDLNTPASPPAAGLLILAIVGFFFAKKHQNIAKVHRDLAKKHQGDTV